MVNSDEFIRNSFRSLLSDGDPNGSEKKSAVGESVLLMATGLAMVSLRKNPSGFFRNETIAKTVNCNKLILLLQKTEIIKTSFPFHYKHF